MNHSKKGFFISRRFLNLNLRAKFILTFLAVALIPLGLLTFLNNRAMRDRLTDDANQALFTAASQTAATLDAFINTNLDVIRTEAELPLWAVYLKLPPDQRSGSDLDPEIRTTLRALSRKTNISSYALLDIEGRTVMDTFASHIGLDKSDRDYFQQPLKTGLPFVSPVEFSQTTGKASLYFSSPVRNPARNIVGVLRIRYDAGILQNIVAQRNNLAGPVSFAVLVDENTIRLANGLAPETIFKVDTSLDSLQIAELQAARRLPDLPVDELVYPAELWQNQAVNKSSTTGKSFFTLSNIVANGKVNQAAVAAMATQPWLVVFVQPQDVFLAPVRAQTRNAILLAALIAGIVGLTATGMGQLLSQPITRLTSVAQQVTTGNLDTQAVVESQDEIGQLATAFNKMTGQLKETIDSLNRRILEQQRTENALRASEAHLRTLVETIPDLVWLKIRMASISHAILNSNVSLVQKNPILWGTRIMILLIKT